MRVLKKDMRLLSFRAPDDLIAAVEERCKKRDITKQEWLERAVRSALLDQEWADGESTVQSHADLRDQIRAGKEANIRLSTSNRAR